MVTDFLRPGSTVNSQLVARAISQAYMNGREVYDTDFAIAQDPTFWEKVQRDAVIKSACEDMLKGVAGRKWNIVAGGRHPERVDHDAAAMMEEVMDQVQNLIAGRYQLAKAKLLGNAWAYIESERRTIRWRGKSLEMLCPVRLVPIDKRSIRSWATDERDAAGRIVVRHEVLREGDHEWRPLPSDAPIVRWVYDDEPARLGHGRGLLEAIYFSHYAKGIVLREGLQGLMKWAQGMVVAKVASGTDATSLSNEATRDAYITMLEKHRAGGVFAMDAEDELQVLWASGEGHRQVFEHLAYIDNAIRQVINGSVLPFGGESGEGSNARSEVEEGRTEGVYQADRELLDEVLSLQLVRRVWNWNRAAFVSLGLGDARVPKLSCVQEPRQDPASAVDVVAKARNAGVPLIKSEVYDRIAFTQPSEDDEVFEGLDMQTINAGIGASAGFPSLAREGGNPDNPTGANAGGDEE